MFTARLIISLVVICLPQEAPPPIGVVRGGFVACEGDRTWTELETIKPSGKAWLKEVEKRVAERVCVRTLADDVVYYGPANVYLPEALVIVFKDRPDAPDSRAWFVHHEAIPAADSALWVTKKQ